MTLQLPGPQQQQKPGSRWNAGGFIRFGLLCVLILVGGFGTWAATAKLSGAVVATGDLRVTAQQQVVQHPDGGVVGEIHVTEGDFVDGGDPLITLDGKSLRSELAALESQLYELMARRGRLTAEQAGMDSISFDRELLERAEEDPEIRSLVDGQQTLFNARRQSMQSELEVLSERQAQLEEQIEGVEAEMASLDRQAELIEEELAGQIRLKEQGLARADRVLSLQREKARLDGQYGQRVSQKAQLKGQIAELELEKVRMVDSRIEEAITQLREIGFREFELKEERIRLQQRLDRLAIRAPRSGVVYDLRVHAIKSVIRPADPVMYIVPTDTGMVIDAKVDPINVDAVYVGQPASLRFTAFNSRTTPSLEGKVVKISAETFQDEKTGAQYYKVEIEPDEGELEKLEGQELVAGMPVESFIKTSERTPFNYMVRPMTDYINRAWREE